MSPTLGEKLRQAREAQGISIREVADQTRISALYLECIENDDYRTLPGGIFNKGFVKSFAKYLGLDPQEALQDYAELLAGQNINPDEEVKTYRPEVLTGNRGNSSTLSTVFFAAVILGLMILGVLMLLKYLPDSQNPIFSNSSINVNANVADLSTNSNSNNLNNSLNIAPALSETKIELKALNAPVSVSSNSDGKRTNNLLTPVKSVIFEPKQNLTLSYSRSQARNVQMTINGKLINLPLEPANTFRRAIELEITNGNFPQIWESGSLNLNNAGNANSAPQTR